MAISAINDTTFEVELFGKDKVKQCHWEERMKKKLILLTLSILLIMLPCLFSYPIVAEDQSLHVYDGYAVEDDTVQRYLRQWRDDSRKANLVGDMCGNYRGYGMSMRFTGLDIPAGAVIQEAYLVMTFVITGNEDGKEGVRSTIRCADAYNPEPISSYEDHISRLRTQEYYYWCKLPVHTTDVEVQSPDFKAEVQEVVDKHNGTGDALIVFWEDDWLSSNDGRYRCVASVEHPVYLPARLHIEYLAGGEPQPPDFDLEICGVGYNEDGYIIKVMPTEYQFVAPYIIHIALPVTKASIANAINSEMQSIRDYVERSVSLYLELEAFGFLHFNTGDILP